MVAALVAIAVLLHGCQMANGALTTIDDAARHEKKAPHWRRSSVKDGVLRAERAHEDWTNVLRAVANGGGVERRDGTTRCVDIPSNFSLCHGIQYTSMRLPNLLEHETLHEAIQQSEAWNSLLQLHCHPDTRLYLCSLFAPICLPNLDKPLYPCESLCLAVQQGCESRMSQYGFPWPEMLRCRFPADNDMCIKPAQSTSGSQHEVICKSCAQVSTFENLMDNYCRSKIVWKVRLKSANATHIIVSKTRGLKSGLRALSETGASKSAERKSRGDHTLAISAESASGCACSLLRQDTRHGVNFLLMAGDAKAPAPRAGKPQAATLIVPWRQDDKNFKRAIRRYRKVNCSTLGREIRESVLRNNFKAPALRGN